MSSEEEKQEEIEEAIKNLEKDKAPWDKERFTSYLYAGHISMIRELSEETGLPINRLLSQALDEFLEDIGYQDKNQVPHLDLENYLEQRRSKDKEEEDDK